MSGPKNFSHSSRVQYEIHPPLHGVARRNGMISVLFLSQNAPQPNTGGIERVVYNLKTHITSSSNITVYTASLDIGKELENHFYLSSRNFADKLQHIIDHLNVKILVCHINVGLNIVKEVNRLNRKNLSIYHHHHHAIVADYAYCLSASFYSAKNACGIIKIVKIFLFPLYFLHIFFSVWYGFYLGVRTADKYILLSKYFKDDLLRLPFIKKYREKIISLTNPHVFTTEKYEEYEKHKIVLFVGRLHYHDKNIPALLKIWKQIENRGTDYTLCIVGDGSDRARLEYDIERMGLQRVVLEGLQKTIADYYKKADFLFLTSKEGWGLVLVEAMEYGCIPFAFDSYSSVKEIIIAGKNGFLIPAGNVKEYADTAIKSFSSDRTVLEEMRRSGYEHIQQFSIQNAVKSWKKLLCRNEVD